MRARASALFPFAALLIAGSAAAAPSTLPTSLTTAITTAQESAANEDCPGVLRALDPVVPTLEKGDDRTFVQRMRLICLGRESRFEELSRVQRELVELLPRDGVVRAFGVLIAAGEKRYVEAADQLAVLARTAPGTLDMLTAAAIREISGQLGRADGREAREARERMLIALSRADWAPAEQPDMRIAFAQVAIGALIGQGDPAEAEGLLERIEEPEMLSGMLIDRHYASLWPAIEARLGPAGSVSVDRYARDKLGSFAISPDSELALREAADAMLLLGRYQDVIDMTDQVVIADGMSREAVQIVLLHARALTLLGRGDAARQLLQGFMKVDLEKTPQVSTALITYAELLDETGHWAQGLEAARDVRARAATVINDVGMRWLDRTEVCTLSALGRTGEASAAMGKLRSLYTQNQAAVIEALLCAKRDSDASTVALGAFKDEDAAGELIFQFQPSGSLWAAAPSRLRDLWTAFLARPEVKAAFERRGRILPRSFWPSREQRNIPRSRGDASSLT